MFKTSDKTDEIMAAIFTAQQKMETVKKSASNPYFKSKYADLNSVLDAIVPHLTEVGIMMLQPTATDGTNNFVVTRLQHIKSGQWIESSLKLELAKPGMQELGSAISYSRRYEPQALLGLQAEDDDGNASSKPVPKYAAQLSKTDAGTTDTTKESKPNGTVKKSTFKRQETDNTEEWN